MFRGLARALLILLIALLIPHETVPALALQAGTVRWDPPINLSNTPGGSTRPAVAADPWGQVHVFWSEKEGGSPTSAGQGPEAGDTIYYRRYDGETWSDPVDLFFAASGSYTDPAAAVDSKGTIHLVWAGPQGVHYSQSPGWMPVSAKSWSPAQVIAQAGQVDQAELAIGPSEHLYVVFNCAGQTNPQVFFLDSPHAGAGWSEPTQVSELRNPDARYALYPRLAIGRKGLLHLVWVEFTGPPEYRGLALDYATSDDGGVTWSEPINLSAHIEPEAETVSESSLVAADDYLVLTYVAGDVAHRYSRVSADGGRTWSAPEQILGDLLSHAGSDGIATDSAGVVHLTAQLRYPFAVYASSWTVGNGWAPPQAVLTSTPLNTAHYLQMVASEGNQLHVVMEEHPAGEIWYMRGTTLASPVSPAAKPTSKSAETPSTPGESTVVPASSPTPQGIPSLPVVQGDADTSGTWSPLLIGLAPVLFILGAVIALRMVRRGAR